MTHRPGAFKGGAVKKAPERDWEGTLSLEEWLKTQETGSWKKFFDQNGYLVVQGLLGPAELDIYRELYDGLLSGEIDASSHRHDLGSHADQKTDTENICQIMWPSVYVEHLDKGPLHQRAGAVARTILGDDMDFDFDMLLSKAPHTNTETPWHQDESYWVDMPDKRTTSCWCAMDDVDVDNGCMWFGAGSNQQPIREHRPVKPGEHVLTCPGSEAEGSPQPLRAGSATFHHGRTMHYSRGNSTDRKRRAFITNYRPTAMVKYERDHNFDHGKGGLDGILASGRTHLAN